MRGRSNQFMQEVARDVRQDADGGDRQSAVGWRRKRDSDGVRPLRQRKLFYKRARFTSSLSQRRFPAVPKSTLNETGRAARTVRRDPSGNFRRGSRRYDPRAGETRCNAPNFPLRPKLSICISLPQSEGHDHKDRKQHDHRDDEREHEPEHFLADYGRGRWSRGLGYGGRWPLRLQDRLSPEQLRIFPRSGGGRWRGWWCEFGPRSKTQGGAPSCAGGRWSSGHVPPSKDPGELPRSGRWRHRRQRRFLRRACLRWRENLFRCGCLRGRRLKESRELAGSGFRGRRGRWGLRSASRRLRPWWRRSLKQPRELAGRGLRRGRDCRGRRSLSRRRWRWSGLADGLGRSGGLEQSGELARCGPRKGRRRRGFRNGSRRSGGLEQPRELARHGLRRRRWRNRNFPFQLRHSAQRLGHHERNPLVISNFQQIGAVGPLRRTKLLHKLRMQSSLLAHEQKHGDSPPRRDLAGVEHLNAFILQQIQ